MYDKQGSVLRVETTIHNARDLTVFRPKEGDPDGPCQHRPLRKGVADLRRRAELCQSANQHYLDGLAAADSSTPLKNFTDVLSRTGARARPTRPGAQPARRRRRLAPGGDRRRVPRQRLSQRGHPSDALRPRPRQPAGAPPPQRRVSRLIRLLRLSRAGQKIAHTQRYLLTTF